MGALVSALSAWFSLESSVFSDSSKSTVDSEPSGSMSPPNARFLADLYGPSSSTSLLNLHASFHTDDDDLSPDDLDDLERKRVNWSPLFIYMYLLFSPSQFHS